MSSGASAPRWCSRLHSDPWEVRKDKHLGRKQAARPQTTQDWARLPVGGASRDRPDWEDGPASPASGPDALAPSKTWEEASRAFFSQTKDLKLTGQTRTGATEVRPAQWLGPLGVRSRGRGCGGLPRGSARPSAGRGGRAVPWDGGSYSEPQSSF